MLSMNKILHTQPFGGFGVSELEITQISSKALLLQILSEVKSCLRKTLCLSMEPFATHDVYLRKTFEDGRYGVILSRRLSR